jgi:hypothetical protein
MTAALLTLGNFTLVIYTLIQVARRSGCSNSNYSSFCSRSGYFDRFEFVMGMHVGLTVAALLLVILFEQNRKYGEALYQELGDELKWSTASQEQTISELTRMRAKDSVKTALRLFSSSIDLPLFPGRVGPGIYAVINVALAVAIIAVVVNAAPAAS